MTTLIAAILLLANPADPSDSTPKKSAEAAVATMRSLLAKGEFKLFYDSHCHKHLRDQVDVEQFVRFMASPGGKPIVDIIVAVDIAIKQKKGPDVLISRLQDNPDEYEIILPQVRNRYPRGGQQWHLEIMKEDGRWKLKDTD